MRNLSLVALYRPSTGRILWWRSFPWRFQHDVNILDDHRISVFDNNVLESPGGEVDGTNRLLVFDFATGQTASPFATGFARNRIATRAQGRGTLLPNGDAMIEETEQGRLLRMAPDGTLRWRYISARSVDAPDGAQLVPLSFPLNRWPGHPSRGERKMHMNTPRLLAVASAMLLALAPIAAQAYTGPGLGLGAIGVAFGLVGSLILAIASVLWYPFKRMLRRMRGQRPQQRRIR